MCPSDVLYEEILLQNVNRKEDPLREFHLARIEDARHVGTMATKPTANDPGEGIRDCPCGSGRALADCCGPILEGSRPAATAEELMRARFTAHVVHDFAFLHRTYRPTAHQPFVPVVEKQAVQWTRLVVHSHALASTPDLAYVEFSAYGTQDGAEHILQEKAEFSRRDGSWIYTRPLREGPAPFRQSAPKPGRNDPCFCGSGKKYKHCCLLKG
jgi:SEC-C motif domain protein